MKIFSNFYAIIYDRGDSMKKQIVIIVCVLLMLSICIFGILNIKKLDDNVSYNVADNGNYYTAKINLNGASKVDEKIIRCKIDNNGCYIMLPNAERNNGTVLGYSDNKNDHAAKYNLLSQIFISSDVELYVISYNEYKLSIDDSNLDFIEENELRCQAYNTSKTCEITLPRYNKVGYENKGYSTSKDLLFGC